MTIASACSSQEMDELDSQGWLSACRIRPPFLILYFALRRRLIWVGAAHYQLALSWVLLALPTSPGPVLYEVLLSTQRFLLPAFPLFLLLGRFGVAHPRLARLLLLVSFVQLTSNTLHFLAGDFFA